MTVPDAGMARPETLRATILRALRESTERGQLNERWAADKIEAIARWNRRTPAPGPWRESEAVWAARSRCYTLIVHPDSTVEVEDAALDALDALCDAVASCGTGGESKEPYLLSCPWCQCDLKTESVIQQVSHLIACGDRYRAKFPAAPTPSGEPGEASVTELIALVESLRGDHYKCDDAFYSCPASTGDDGAWKENRGPCTCGFVRRSEAVDRVCAALLAGRSGSAPTPSGEREKALEEAAIERMARWMAEVYLGQSWDSPLCNRERHLADAREALTATLATPRAGREG